MPQWQNYDILSLRHIDRQRLQTKCLKASTIWMETAYGAYMDRNGTAGRRCTTARASQNLHKKLLPLIEPECRQFALRTVSNNGKRREIHSRTQQNEGFQHCDVDNCIWNNSGKVSIFAARSNKTKVYLWLKTLTHNKRFTMPEHWASQKCLLSGCNTCLQCSAPRFSSRQSPDSLSQPLSSSQESAL